MYTLNFSKGLTRAVSYMSIVMLVINTLVSSYFLYNLPPAHAQEEEIGVCELVVTKTDYDAEVMPGEKVTYHLTITNNGSATCPADTLLKDFYDSDETSFVSSVPEPVGMHVGPDYIKWLAGALAPDQTFAVDVTMQVLETVPCDSTVSDYALWHLEDSFGPEVPESTPVICEEEPEPYCGDGDTNQESEQCDDGNQADGDGCSALCQIEEEPETPPAPWCSVLYGVFTPAYNTPENYNDPADLSDDQEVSASDFALISSIYTPGSGDNEACYLEFDGFDSENYLDIDWCNGIYQGLQDGYYNVSEGDPKYFAPFDLDNDGDISVADFGILASWIGENNQQACYCQFTDYFPGYGCEQEPPVEDGSITVCKYDPQENLLSGWEMTLYSPNLVVNGDFEYPVVTDHSGQWELFNSAAVDWNIEWVNTEEESEPVLEYQTNLLGTPFSGSQYAELDTHNDSNMASVKISQDIMTNIGTDYELGFAFSPRVGRDLADNQLGVQFGSINETMGADGTSNVDTVWTHYNYNFTADTANTTLSFTDLGTSNTFGTFVDDVSVRSMSSGTTGENGCVVFDNLPFGTYEVYETLQDGWVQIYPENGYHIVTIDSKNPDQTVNFVNEYEEENPPEELYCGDGSVNQESEQCDDGNQADGDGCSAQCLIEEETPSGGGGGGYSGSGGRNAYCGDGKKNRSQEQCDDGNQSNGDGCSALCLLEEVEGEKITNDTPPSEPVSESPQGVLGYTELPATGGGVDNSFVQLLASGLVSLYGATLLKLRYRKS